MLIAVDGTAASGKGTLARHLAARLNLKHLDTGSLYRSVGLSLLRSGHSTSDVTPEAAENAAKNLDFSLAEDPAIRTVDAGTMASVVAAMEPVRAALMASQRRFAETANLDHDGAVLDGRDIGTVILPHADHKFFVDADPRIRAERRLRELQENGTKTDLDTVLDGLIARDRRDSARDVAPLKQAEDAILVDTGAKTVEEMVAFALSMVAR